ncbi:hypothetical protein BW716_34420 [[Flexibacter] sp. ATCC 35208]|nr:hypothetical protein BW716_34420 [[Flexibacter] sp. ATCC 35208]
MPNIELTETSENTESINISDLETLKFLKILAKILLSVNHLEPVDTPVVNINPIPEKLAA